MTRRIYELILALAALAWGGWLLLPINTFESSTTFRVLNATAPEWIWGGLMAGAGCQLLYGLWRDSYTVRRWSIAIMVCLWFAIWCTLVISNWRSTATVTYVFWVILCAVSYLKAGRNGVAYPQP